ncbi:MAG TPA: DUF3124 domain-containing protein [Syntrophales bacterium]|nr:DUF3124 domain-containing protein [Syntrophales bacterium]
MKRFISVLVCILILSCVAACRSNERNAVQPVASESSFDASILTVKETDARKIKGQVVYAPIYSNLPRERGKKFDISGFVTIHNTDLSHKIRITKVLYFNNDGKLVKDFTPQGLALEPLGATNFYIPQSDQSGTGANFLVEWVSDTPVCEPLIESIMINLGLHETFAFQSRGRAIREQR